MVSNLGTEKWPSSDPPPTAQDGPTPDGSQSGVKRSKSARLKAFAYSVRPSSWSSKRDKKDEGKQCAKAQKAQERSQKRQLKLLEDLERQGRKLQTQQASEYSTHWPPRALSTSRRSSRVNSSSKGGLLRRLSGRSKRRSTHSGPLPCPSDISDTFDNIPSVSRDYNIDHRSRRERTYSAPELRLATRHRSVLARRSIATEKRYSYRSNRQEMAVTDELFIGEGTQAKPLGVQPAVHAKSREGSSQMANQARGREAMQAQHRKSRAAQSRTRSRPRYYESMRLSNPEQFNLEQLQAQQRASRASVWAVPPSQHQAPPPLPQTHVPLQEAHAMYNSGSVPQHHPAMPQVNGHAPQQAPVNGHYGYSAHTRQASRARQPAAQPMEGAFHPPMQRINTHSGVKPVTDKSPKAAMPPPELQPGQIDRRCISGPEHARSQSSQSSAPQQSKTSQPPGSNGPPMAMNAEPPKHSMPLSSNPPVPVEVASPQASVEVRRAMSDANTPRFNGTEGQAKQDGASLARPNTAPSEFPQPGQPVAPGAPLNFSFPVSLAAQLANSDVPQEKDEDD
ncbi:hypothetical protein KEM55_002260, partial [Ascosphaera atra]